MTGQNVNFLSPIGFQFGLVKLPDIGFKTQRCNIPGISMGNPMLETPFVGVPEPGDKIDFEPFMIDFMIDESMANYLSVWEWLIGLGFPNNWEEFIDGPNRNLIHTSDGFLQILGSDNKIVKTVTFKDMFPINLTAVTFQSVDSDVNYLQATATFRYTSFRFD